MLSQQQRTPSIKSQVTLTRVDDVHAVTKYGT
jgi:hypothetical protein